MMFGTGREKGKIVFIFLHPVERSTSLVTDTNSVLRLMPILGKLPMAALG